MADALLALVRTLHIGSAMTLVALPFFTTFILRPRQETDAVFDRAFYRRLVSLLWIALGIEFVSGAAWLWLVAAGMSDDSAWGGATVSDLGIVMLQTRFGVLWIGRGVGLAILAGILVWLEKSRALESAKPRMVTWLFLALGAGLLGSLAWSGHAAAGVRWPASHLTVDVIHLLAGAVWPLGLFPFALFLKGSKASDLTEANLAVASRFSRASFAAVIVLVVSGVSNSWLMLASWATLFDSLYGRLLLGKVFVVALMIGLGAFNRFRLLPTFSRDGSSRLARSVVGESILALLVLLIVGLMGITPPGS